MSDEPPTPGEWPNVSVLICDDNGAMRVLLGVLIDTAPGPRIAGEAGDGNKAVIEARRLQPHVILLDLAAS